MHASYHQQREAGADHLWALPEQADRDEEISVAKKGWAPPRHSDTIQNCEDDGHRRTAGRMNGGPVYPLRDLLRGGSEENSPTDCSPVCAGNILNRQDPDTPSQRIIEKHGGLFRLIPAG